MCVCVFVCVCARAYVCICMYVSRRLKDYKKVNLSNNDIFLSFLDLLIKIDNNGFPSSSIIKEIFPFSYSKNAPFLRSNILPLNALFYLWA